MPERPREDAERAVDRRHGRHNDNGRGGSEVSAASSNSYGYNVGSITIDGNTTKLYSVDPMDIMAADPVDIIDTITLIVYLPDVFIAGYALPLTLLTLNTKGAANQIFGHVPTYCKSWKELCDRYASAVSNGLIPADTEKVGPIYDKLNPQAKKPLFGGDYCLRCQRIWQFTADNDASSQAPTAAIIAFSNDVPRTITGPATADADKFNEAQFFVGGFSDAYLNI